MELDALEPQVLEGGHWLRSIRCHTVFSRVDGASGLTMTDLSLGGATVLAQVRPARAETGSTAPDPLGAAFKWASEQGAACSAPRSVVFNPSLQAEGAGNAEEVRDAAPEVAAHAATRPAIVSPSSWAAGAGETSMSSSSSQSRSSTLSTALVWVVWQSGDTAVETSKAASEAGGAGGWVDAVTWVATGGWGGGGSLSPSRSIVSNEGILRSDCKQRCRKLGAWVG